ncbi:MAG TPA: hypothetical protein VK186_03255 [Candidatus Deferrimicrobium sp.]|nr:hypothetical protein [Candidatus Deferrimicrobium sp.]
MEKFETQTAPSKGNNLTGIGFIIISNFFGCPRYYPCFTNWSLAMLDNALSPEIGGNFIESINQRAFYFRERQTRIGFYQIEEALHFELKRLFIPSDNTDHNDVR